MTFKVKTKGQNEGDNLIVPKLRFKEFKNTWQKMKIKDIAVVIGGGTPDTNNVEYWNGNINWFTPSEIGKQKYINKSERKITYLGLKNSSARLLPIGTILLTSRATIGEASILLEEGCTNQGFQSLIAKERYAPRIYILFKKILL